MGIVIPHPLAELHSNQNYIFKKTMLFDIYETFFAQGVAMIGIATPSERFESDLLPRNFSMQCSELIG